MRALDGKHGTIVEDWRPTAIERPGPAELLNGMIPTISVPEPFASALNAGEPGDVCDADVPSAEARFGRALARALVGREADARADFASAQESLGDPCRVELALLDIRERAAVKDALATAEDVAAKAESGASLRARAFHVAGLALGKLRRHAAAMDVLLRAVRIYRDLGDPGGRARVHDTIGMLEAARGKLDAALHSFALSLVDKSLTGDRHGIAITLGNLGRVHLRAGRFSDAHDCLKRDLDLAEKLGDQRGVARVREDLGRTHLAAGDLSAAEAEFGEALRLARQMNFKDLVFFTRKDLALLRIAQGKLPEASRELEEARACLPDGGEEYLRDVLRAAEGELLTARGDPKAADVLDEVARAFETADLPDLEVPARISLARALIAQGLKARAERCVLEGIRRAKKCGYPRYVPVLHEVMAELDLVEGAGQESDRRVVTASNRRDDEYVVLERLGSGAFGEVFRAYDPRRGCEVALKRLHLDQLYDVKARNGLIASARVELEAASRVRHPGVARVLALGTEPDGALYLVHELVPGRPLRDRMPGEPVADPVEVGRTMGRAAQALQALHEARVVHRDLKPENILVRGDGTPVLVDFGIAHTAGGAPRFDRDHIAGTLEYMAPEQAMGKGADPRVDLYALGVVLFEWLAGVRPLRLRGSTFAEKAQDLAERPAPPLSGFRRGIDPRLEAFVARLLEKKPRRRPGSAAECADFLLHLS